MQKGLDALCCTTHTHVFWLMLAGSHLGRHQNPSTWPPLHVASSPRGHSLGWFGLPLCAAAVFLAD